MKNIEQALSDGAEFARNHRGTLVALGMGSLAVILTVQGINYGATGGYLMATEKAEELFPGQGIEDALKDYLKNFK